MKSPTTHLEGSARTAALNARVARHVFRETLNKTHAALPHAALPTCVGGGLNSLQQAAQAHLKWENTLQAARLHMSEVIRHTQTARYENELVDIVCRELRIAFDEPSAAASSPATDALPFVMPQDAGVEPLRMSSHGKAEKQAASNAEAAIALVSRIEVFLRGMLPRISMTLNNSLGATVDIERMGPRAVSVRLKGKNGPPKPEEVSRLRDAMGERGLKLMSLSVA
ncbi:MAG: hypothetical protein K1X64_13420 [Myxococcaceae bacterium]|nr:hypothetical protein [Myxococcaceae bacterium]